MLGGTASVVLPTVTPRKRAARESAGAGAGAGELELCPSELVRRLSSAPRGAPIDVSTCTLL